MSSDLDHWKQLLNTVTFMPGFRLDAATEGHERPMLYVEATQPDARHGGTTQVHAWYTLGPWPGQPAAVARIRECLHAYWAHEVDEWLRVDGQLANDPHEPLAAA